MRSSPQVLDANPALQCVGVIVSKIRDIENVIGNAHCLGPDPLKDYHAARKVRNACRVVSCNERFLIIRNALHAYNVTITLLSSDPIQIRIRNNRANTEIVL